MEKKIEINRQKTLAQQCYDRLHEDILNGILEPGAKIKIAPLKEQFKIGQSPIREALSRLVASGLVTVEDNKGFRVTEISEEDVRDTYAVLLFITKKGLEQAIMHATSESKAQIVTELYRLALVETGYEKIPYAVWAEHNYAFHRALIAGCRSPLLLEIYALVYTKFDRYCRIAYSKRHSCLEANHAEHKALAQSVLDQNFVVAQKLIEQHINSALEDVIKALKKQKCI